jgi:hypothetical protein
MQYLDDLITRMAIKCVAISPSGGGGSGGVLTVDNTIVTVDSTIITSDQTIYI